MGRNLVSGINFDPFGPNLDPKSLLVDFTSTRCYTLLQAIFFMQFQGKLMSQA